MQAIPMTLRGAEKLREELDFLKSVRRPEIIAAIAEAREHGDSILTKNRLIASLAMTKLTLNKT